MPTSPSPNMGLVLPTLNSDIGLWDDYLNAAIGGQVDAHDHTLGKGVKVPTGGLNIDADLSFGGKAALNLGAVQMTPVAAAFLAGKNRSFWVNSVDNELYFRNNSGTDIKFTTGGTLNISLVGGIGGDYTAAGALFSFDDATDRFLAQQQGSPRPWAGMAIGNLDIYEQAPSIANRVRLQSPAGLAASYALTLPTALPGSTLLLQLSAAGAITASNTIANAVSLGSTLNVAGVATFPGNIGGTPTFTGAVTLNTTLAVGTNATIGGTLGVTSLITASAGITLGVNQHVTTSGGGRYLHGLKFMSCDMLNAFSTSGGTYTIAVVGNRLYGELSAGATTYIPIRVRLISAGDRVTRFWLVGDVSGTEPTITVYTQDFSGTVTTQAATVTGSMIGGRLVTLTTPLQITNSELLYIRAVGGSGTTQFWLTRVEFDHTT